MKIATVGMMEVTNNRYPHLLYLTTVLQQGKRSLESVLTRQDPINNPVKVAAPWDYTKAVALLEA